VRRFGHFDTAEDATQEALLAAALQWPSRGIPDNPRGWLITVAARRLTDLLRSEQARRRREDTVARQALPAGRSPATDDTLIVVFLCCHPSLSPAAQIALTLRAAGGLGTAQIARAFLVPEATMARRISRAKRTIKDSGVPFALPVDRAERLGAVLHTLYLIFNEGYVSTAGPDLAAGSLSAEAIRLTRMVHRLLPDDTEVMGLLALMLLTDARRPARTGPCGELIPMAEQDRSRWDAALIAEGVDLLTRALPRGATGPYQLQAAIAAVHDEAPSAQETDWAQITALYGLLMRISDNPVVGLNHAVAVGMCQGPRAGLDLLETAGADERLAADHRVDAVRAHLLEMAGDPAAAHEAYERAAHRATNLAQRRYLHARAARLNRRS
jgi:predicted RNA polymerase sigma factor